MSADKDQLRSEAINLTALQGERLREIGAYLRQTRLDRQVSLEDIRQQTFIQVYQLHAIETGDLQVLPEPVYVQGFIKKYAIALGLNGQELATSFPVSRPR
ncbi:MAG: helix-turn-helix domain-containing protein [Cyanobacteria bacterium]|nr:helix-turn-helix domain-containing protein [Cyanobacteriota bacterium]MEB3268498.1 helix-turn-helix domain-containing protein [Leptolyngbya sp.]